MNNVNRNKVHNYIYLYNIQDNEENLLKNAEVINKREYYIYHQILCIIDNCKIIEEDWSSIRVKIDLIEHRKLLEDITKNSFKKKLGMTKVEEKYQHAYVGGNLFLTLKIYNGF